MPLIFTPQGSPLSENYFSVPVNIRQTAATAANATVFAMRNASGSGKDVFIQRVYLIMSFDSVTPITRATLRYSLSGFGGATPTGGTSVNVANMNSDNLSTVVTDVRFLDTGLTVTNVNFSSSASVISCPACDGSVSPYLRENIATRLAPGEGLCIRLNQAAVVGQALCGEIVWAEMPI